MVSGKAENDFGKDSLARLNKEASQVRPPRTRRRRMVLIWLCIDLTVAIVVIGLLLYRPAGYKPVLFGVDGNDPGHVDRYFTYLSSEIYNGAQTRRPFDLVVLEDGINRAIGPQRWSDPSGEAVFFAPRATFSPEGVVLMGTAELKGASFVVTVGIEPKVNEQGLLALHVTQVKVGALNLTPLARMLARRMYAQRLATAPIDTEDIRTHIAGSLLDDKAFMPVLLVRDRRVRLEAVRLQKGQVVLGFAPVSGR